MEKSSLVITNDRLPGKVIQPASYQFSKKEQLLFDVNSIRQYETVVLADISRRPVKPPEVKRLATRFASLKSLEDVNRFAREYGLLGITVEPDSIHDSPAYGEAWFEPLSAWQHHIENVRRLMLLYRALTRWKKGFDVEIEEKLLRRERIDIYFRRDKKENLPEINYVTWHDGRGIGIQLVNTDDGSAAAYLPAIFGTAFSDTLPLNEHPDEYGLAIMFLAALLRHNLQGGINLDFSKIIPAKDATIGFRIVETRSTPYLLAAIYYNLWELITDNRQVITCKNCGLPLEKIGRREFCNNACKQAWYRKHKKREC